LVHGQAAKGMPKMNKKQQKRLNAPLSNNQFIHTLDKLKLSRTAKKAIFKARKAGGVL
jgi:hypothetical protein